MEQVNLLNQRGAKPVRPHDDNIVVRLAIMVVVTVVLVVLAGLYHFDTVKTDHLLRIIQRDQDTKRPPINLIRDINWKANHDPSQVIGLYLYNATKLEALDGAKNANSNTSIGDYVPKVDPKRTYVSVKQLPSKVRVNPTYADDSYVYDRLTLLVGPDQYIHHAWYG